MVADYGQLELRLLAHMAECQSMLEAFRLGGDFHSRTALGMYDHIKVAIDQGAQPVPSFAVDCGWLARMAERLSRKRVLFACPLPLACTDTRNTAMSRGRHIFTFASCVTHSMPMLGHSAVVHTYGHVLSHQSPLFLQAPCEGPCNMRLAPPLRPAHTSDLSDVFSEATAAEHRSMTA